MAAARGSCKKLPAFNAAGELSRFKLVTNACSRKFPIATASGEFTRSNPTVCACLYLGAGPARLAGSQRVSEGTADWSNGESTVAERHFG